MNKAMGLISANYSCDALGALTAERPVAAVPFGARYRLLDFALSNMVNSGLRTVGIIMPYQYRPILDHLGAGREWFLDRKSGGMFILPGSNYGLKNMTTKFLLRDVLKNTEYLSRGREEYVVVSSANQVSNLNYTPILNQHQESGADITLVYKEGDTAQERLLDKDLLEIEAGGRVRALIPKAKTDAEKFYYFADSFVINRQLLLQLAEWYKAVEYVDVQDIIRENVGSLKIYGWEFKGYLGRVESIESFLRCNMDLLDTAIRTELLMAEQKIHTKIKDNSPAHYSESAVVKNSLIPGGCIIEGEVENSILFRKVTVEKGAVVKNCVIMQNSSVGADARVENVIADKFVSLRPETILKGRAEDPVIIGKKGLI